MATTSASQFQLSQSFRHRLYVFLGLVVVTALVFSIQLVRIQIIQGEELENLAEIFGTRTINLKAPRGNMFDRNYNGLDTGTKLVSSLPSQDIILKPALFRKKPERIRRFIRRFARVMGHPEKFYEQVLDEAFLKKVISRNEDIVLLKNINQAIHERVSGFNDISSKIQIVSSSRRIYHMRAALAHVTGYIGAPTRAMLREGNVKSDDMVGIAGLEREYNSYLRGQDGVKILKHSGAGYYQEEMVKQHPVPGRNLVLTIDAGIQKGIYEAMRERVGAVVALRPATGEVLGMFSNPSFDPQILSWSQDKARYRSHLKEIFLFKAFQNRVIQNAYPPASTFKPLVALAALAEGKIEEDFNYKCTGKYIVKAQYASGQDHAFHDYATHGNCDLTRALALSCSTYFYVVGRKLGSQKILDYARMFNLDQESKIDLAGERSGFLPSKEWKLTNRGESWYVGDTVLLSIGQGFTLTTPIGVALMYAGFANDGVIYQPYLVKEVRDPVDDTVIYKTPERRILKGIPLPQEALDTVKRGLMGVTTYGTAGYIMRRAKLPPMAGKTGTAQTRSKGKASTQHGWFVGWGPVEAPPEQQVLVTVFVEYGGSGAGGAAPVAAKIFQAAFEGFTWDPAGKTLVPKNKAGGE